MVSSMALAQVSNLPIVSAEKLSLNRGGKKLDLFNKAFFKPAHTGFMWKSDDNLTLKWRPQGITGYVAGSRKYLLISWYGRKEEKYGNRGSRISFVNVANMDKITYRHILLVDENLKTFPNMHAGGLVVAGDKLHVPDSRGANDEIKVFDLKKIREVNPDDYHGYRYIMIEESSYKMDLNPSFLGYDASKNLFVVGSFSQKESYSDANKIAWYKYENGKAKMVASTTFVKEMQGAVSGVDAKGNNVLWVSCSYGGKNRSRLHTMNYKINADGSVTLSNKRKVTYPPGLEDIHISKSGNVWLLTEFGPKEVITSNRVVFAVKKSKLMP